MKLYVNGTEALPAVVDQNLVVMIIAAHHPISKLVAGTV